MLGLQGMACPNINSENGRQARTTLKPEIPICAYNTSSHHPFVIRRGGMPCRNECWQEICVFGGGYMHT